MFLTLEVFDGAARTIPHRRERKAADGLAGRDTAQGAVLSGLSGMIRGARILMLPLQEAIAWYVRAYGVVTLPQACSLREGRQLPLQEAIVSYVRAHGSIPSPRTLKGPIFSRSLQRILLADPTVYLVAAARRVAHQCC